jgi:hypothetical protein
VAESEPGADRDAGATTPRSSGSSIAIDKGLRYVALAVITVLTGLGLAGAVGVRSRTVTAAGAGLELSARYGQIVRPGLAVPFEISIRATDGAELPRQLEVRVTSSYLAMFDENGLEPEPHDAWSGDGRTVWTYAVPEGERELVISLDARIEPAVQLERHTATVDVETNDGRAVTVELTSWVLP